MLKTALLIALALSPAAQAVVELSPDFFPGLDQHDDAQIRLHGLAALFPGRVLFEAPRLTPPSARTEAARIEDLPREIKYIRVYRLDEATAAIRQHGDAPSLILDFRYVRSPHTGSELAAALHGNSELPAPSTVGVVPETITDELEALKELSADRSHPTIVLCNRETAGPFEALLYNMQQQGAIIAVGEPTAGQTAFYQKINPRTWMIEGELRPQADVSLVGTGFTPRIQIKVTAEENYSSYHLYEAGTPINRLLRQESRRTHTEDQPTEETTIEHDRILQRGVDIAAALQVIS